MSCPDPPSASTASLSIALPPASQEAAQFQLFPGAMVKVPCGPGADRWKSSVWSHVYTLIHPRVCPSCPLQWANGICVTKTAAFPGISRISRSSSCSTPSPFLPFWEMAPPQFLPPTKAPEILSLKTSHGSWNGLPAKDLMSNRPACG